MKHHNPQIKSPILIDHAREMRHAPTPAENLLWRQLRNRALNGLKFRRQVPIGPFIVDFYCHEYRLIIEVDGDTHAETEAYDASRTEWLENGCYQVVRFTNTEVKGQLDLVLTCILECCCREKADK